MTLIMQFREERIQRRTRDRDSPGIQFIAPQLMPRKLYREKEHERDEQDYVQERVLRLVLELRDRFAGAYGRTWEFGYWLRNVHENRVGAQGWL